MSELFEYVVAYAKQETFDPVLGQLKALGKGIAGAALVALGTVLLGLGFLRALQSELGSTHAAASAGWLAYAPLTKASRLPAMVFPNPVYPNPYGVGAPLSGDWSWAPYMGAALVCILVAAFCATRISKGLGR